MDIYLTQEVHVTSKGRRPTRAESSHLGAGAKQHERHVHTACSDFLSACVCQTHDLTHRIARQTPKLESTSCTSSTTPRAHEAGKPVQTNNATHTHTHTHTYIHTQLARSQEIWRPLPTGTGMMAAWTAAFVALHIRPANPHTQTTERYGVQWRPDPCTRRRRGNPRGGRGPLGPASGPGYALWGDCYGGKALG